MTTLLQKKTNHILFLSSNCDTADGRDSFVQRFMEFVDVDSIGSCLHNKDYPSDIRGFELNPVTGQSYRDSWHGNCVLKLEAVGTLQVSIGNAKFDMHGLCH